MSSESFKNETRLIDSINRYSTRDNVVRLGIEICRQIISYRRNGVYHSVITPADIYVSDTGEFRLELVSARTIGHGEEFSQAIQLYAAPEIDCRANAESCVIYSLGTVMYRLLNANLEPFRETTDFEGARRAYELRMSKAVPAAPVNADAALSAIILRACQYDADARFRSVEDMLECLQTLAEGNYQRIRKEESTSVTDKPDAKKRFKLIIAAALSGVIFASIIIGCINYHYNDIYIRAERRLRDDRFDDARRMFESIRRYRDSAVMTFKCDYKKADALEEEGKLSEAMEIFGELAGYGYEDSLERYNNTLLLMADQFASEGKTDDAEKFINMALAANSKEAGEALKNHRYDTAMKMYKSGKYEQACGIFEELGDKEMANECKYSLADSHMQNNSLAEAMALYSSLGSFAQSEKKFQLCEKQLMEKNENVFDSYSDIEGRYADEGERYVEYMTEDNVRRSKYNVPFDNGAYFKLENGVHYHSMDMKKWKKQWIFEKVSPSEIRMYNYKDGKMYVFK